MLRRHIDAAEPLREDQVGVEKTCLYENVSLLITHIHTNKNMLNCPTKYMNFMTLMPFIIMFVHFCVYHAMFN